MTARSSTLADRKRRSNASADAIVRWCPDCRDVQSVSPTCLRCGVGDSPALALVRGLSSINVADEYGLVRYRGERNVAVVGLLLVGLIPLAAAAALASELTGLASVLLGIAFVGLPALAFFDAHRAGARSSDSAVELPPVAPLLPEHAGADTLARASYRGAATVARELLDPPLSDEPCIGYRLDIRVGGEGELVVRYTSENEFMVTCDDGTRVLVAGVMELTAPGYDTVQATEKASFVLAGSYFLPALFARGGWACEALVRTGSAVRVEGPCSDESHAPERGSSYRQPGVIPVLRGIPGQPVIVEVL